MKEVQDILDHYAEKQEDTIKASSYWVWTVEAEQQSRGRRRAGKRIDTTWQPYAPVWMVEQQLIVDEEVFPYPEGQADLMELI
ncbi:hypothetical protein [Paenibacillus hunanensis]|uniref:Uncharacterized protein n=1 Tax=Paenibacillus hunanensis TaxID=539262 RepID=A0ABU1IW01_9BACL|nr:hypothetical protein [Paenibacillus hunanensis]MDR6243444.1 hypothetical protein [Paenibacillus hunanensis]GGI97765.1 hypothetical protein GCM10008022_03080 [Paenibacillus hunanensis]